MDIKNTALVLEGGGMRASYSSGVINVFLKNNINFKFITGVSAGSSLTANYLSRDRERVKKSFTEIVKAKEFGGIKSFIKGDGYFNANWIYLKTFQKDALLPYDFETFINNDADFKIGAVKKSSGELKFFRKKDIKTAYDLILRVKASSSMPIIMPETIIDNEAYLDGGIMGGISIDSAIEEGYKKFLVIRTREEDYRKKKLKKIQKVFLKLYYRNYPKIYDILLKRNDRYNNEIEKILNLRKEGKCYIIHPKKMELTNSTTDYNKLIEYYNMGYNQAEKELENIIDFLKE